jgi:acetyl-CoA carboxylase carboxyltransferase component
MTSTNTNDPYGLAKLADLSARARSMGGERKISKQHEKGLLTVRERIDRLLDPGTFDELGLLTCSDVPEAREKTPADGKVIGYGEIDARPVFVSGDDVTVMAGAGGRKGVEKLIRNAELAVKRGYPCIHLGDGGGARLPDIMGSVGMMSMTYPIKGPCRDRQVPLITTIMGECYGGPTWEASVSDIIIQVKGSVMAVAAPSILEIATGECPDKEDLGGWELHAEVTGQVDLFAENDEDCLRLVRKVLSYLPDNADGPPKPLPCSEPSPKRLDGIFDLVPANPRKTYDMHKVIEMIADRDSVLELKPYYDGSLITCLARLDGQVVGFLANNPGCIAGAMGPGACEKATGFICLCDSYHIPMIFLHDTPGFLVGQDAERRKMPLKIMTFIEALHKSTVPRISVIIRKSYGMAHCNMSGGNMQNELLLAWPTADISFMDPHVAVNVAFGRKMKGMDNVEDMKKMMLAELTKGSGPWDAAGQNLIDKVIDPADTRTELVTILRRARGTTGRKAMSQRHLAGWPRMF